MFLRQVVLQRGIPFEMKIPKREPLIYQELTKEQFDAEMQKGFDDIKAGRTHSLEEVRESFQKEYGIWPGRLGIQTNTKKSGEPLFMPEPHILRFKNRKFWALNKNI